MFEEIFSASQVTTHWTEESTPLIGFVLLINGRGIDAVVDPRKRVCKQLSIILLVHACAESSESQQKPVISHVNACLKANMKINCGTYNNNTWEMEQSLSLQSSQPRRGCLSLWEDVWLPPLYVCFEPLSWFSNTSTFPSKHVKIFHAH